MEKSEIQKRVHKYLENPKNLQQTLERWIDDLFTNPINELLPNQIQIPSISILKSLLSNTKTVQQSLDIGLHDVYPYKTLAAGMDPKTGESLGDFLESIEVQPSKKLIVDLLNQKPIQDIIANIIESGIIEFNKKTNPLFGMIQATGLDKQIKSFINLFLPNFLPKIAEFLHNTSFGETSTLTKDLCFVILNSEFGELNLPDQTQMAEAEEKLNALKAQILSDSKLIETTSNFANTILNRFLEKNGDHDLKAFFGISHNEYETFKTSLSEYITTQILQNKEKLKLELHLSEFISEILS